MITVQKQWVTEEFWKSLLENGKIRSPLRSPSWMHRQTVRRGVFKAWPWSGRWNKLDSGRSSSLQNIKQFELLSNSHLDITDIPKQYYLEVNIQINGLPRWLSVKESACYSGNAGSIPSRSLEKEMAVHSSILSWEIPQTEEPGGLQSKGVAKSWIQWSKNNNMQIYRWYRGGI